jgi:hypothetical protein
MKKKTRGFVKDFVFLIKTGGLTVTLFSILSGKIDPLNPHDRGT